MIGLKFIKGLVSSAHWSSLGDERNLKASKLENFYTSVDDLTTRRPPAKTVDFDIPDWAKFGMRDYIDDSGRQLFIGKPEWLIPPQGTTDFRIVGNGDTYWLFYIIQNRAHKVQINHVDVSSPNVVATLATNTESSIVSDTSFTDEIFEFDGQFFTIMFGHTFVFETGGKVVNKYGGEVVIDPGTNVITSSADIPGTIQTEKVQLDKIKVQIMGEYTRGFVTDSGNLVDIVLKNTTESAGLETFAGSDIYRSFPTFEKDYPVTVNKYSVYPKTEKLDEQLSKNTAPISNSAAWASLGIDLGETDKPGSLVAREYIKNWVKQTVKRYDYNSKDSVLADVIKKAVASKLQAVTTTVKSEEGFRIMPDIKLRSENPDVSEYGNLIYEDDDWYVFAYPEAGAYTQMTRWQDRPRQGPSSNLVTEIASWYEFLNSKGLKTRPDNEGELVLAYQGILVIEQAKEEANEVLRQILGVPDINRRYIC